MIIMLYFTCFIEKERGEKMFRTIITVIYVVIFLILSLPVMLFDLIVGIFNRNARDYMALHLIQGAFKGILMLTGTKVYIIGEDRVPKDTAVLYVGNHRSIFDTIITLSRVPRLTCYVSKKEMDRVPIFNLWMRMLYCLFLDRDDIKSGLKMILEAVELAKKGISVCIFPEGTRSKVNGEMLPFKEGSFKVATKANIPIVPMTIINSADILEDHLPKVKKTKVLIEYGEPIYPDSLDRETLKHIGAYTHEIIEKTYAKNVPVWERLQ